MFRAVTIGAGLVLVSAVFLGVVVADAAIITFGGAVTPGAPPASVVNGVLESDTSAIVFLEQSNLTLASNLDVNITVPGTYTGNIAPSATIAAGTVIESYFFHMDLVGTSGGNTTYVGFATFDTDNLGLITSEPKLNATDPLLGLRTVAYPTSVIGINRGSLDSPGAFDTVTLSADRRTVSFALGHDDGNIEQFRVITLIPEPSTLALAVFGFAALIA